VGSWLFTLFLVLWRSRLVPRSLAGLGLLATVLQVTGVPLWALLGLDVVTPLAMPLAPIYVAVAAWLLVKGFEERQGSIPEGPPATTGEDTRVAGGGLPPAPTSPGLRVGTGRFPRREHPT
jgi:hypothetical protein